MSGRIWATGSNVLSRTAVAPGGMGSSRLSNLEPYEIAILARELSCLEPDYDLVLVDLAAGISPANLRWMKPAHDRILVTNPEVTALIEAYGLVKCLALEGGEAIREINVVMNRVRDEAEFHQSMKKLRQVVAKHLSNVRLNSLGYIPFDRYLLHSIAIQRPAVLSPQGLCDFLSAWHRGQVVRSLSGLGETPVPRCGNPFLFC